MKSLTCLIGVVSALFFASAQAQSGDSFSGLSEIPLLENQSLTQYRETFHPPLPDVWVDGVLMSWEEVYGPIVILPPPVADNLSRSASSSALLRTQQVAESAPFTRQFADPQTRATALSSNSPTRIDFVRLAELTAIHKEKDPSTFESLEITLIRSEDANTNLCVGIKGSVTNQFALDYTCYKLSIENIPTDEEVEVFFSEKASLGEWLTTSLACVGTNDSTGIKIYVATVKGHHSDGFFTAALACDTDDDGLSDAVEELIFKSNPDNSDSNFLRDGNGNGSPDFPGKANNWVCDGDEDLDGDGWSNADEIAMGTDPFVAQNNGLDVDDDGLPDWAEQNLFVWRGVQNQNAFVDSDGDGINNYTELVLNTDVSHVELFYDQSESDNTFYNNQSRVFQIPVFFLENESATNVFPYGLIFDFCGPFGSFLNLKLSKNVTSTNGVFYDQISLSGATGVSMSSSDWGIINFSSGNNITDININTNIIVLTEGLSTTHELIGKMAEIFLDDNRLKWSEPGISDAIEDVLSDSAVIISNRSLGRISLIMKRLQLLGCDLTINLRNQPIATQQRICKLVGNMLSEASLYNRAQTRYSYSGNPIPVLTHINRCTPYLNGFCSYLGVFNVPPSLDQDVTDYLSAVRYPDEFADMYIVTLANTLTDYIMDVGDTYPTYLQMLIWNALDSLVYE